MHTETNQVGNSRNNNVASTPAVRPQKYLKDPTAQLPDGSSGVLFRKKGDQNFFVFYLLLLLEGEEEAQKLENRAVTVTAAIFHF